MRTFFLVVLPLAVIFMLAGCEEGVRTSGYSSPSPAKAAPARESSQAAAPAPSQPQPQLRRNSTTQPLPAGWEYIHLQDVAGDRTAAPGADI